MVFNLIFPKKESTPLFLEIVEFAENKIFMWVFKKKKRNKKMLEEISIMVCYLIFYIGLKSQMKDLFYWSNVKE